MTSAPATQRGRRRARVVVAGLLGAAGLSGCGGRSATPATTVPAATGPAATGPAATTTTSAPPTTATAGGAELVLGFYGPLTGTGRAVAVDVADGEKLAVSQYMAGAPDPPVAVDVVDSTGGALALARLVAGHPVAVIDTQDPGAGVAAAGVPSLTVTPVDVGLAQRSDTTAFRVVADIAAQGLADGSFLAKTLAAHDVAVFDDGSPGGQALAGYVALELDQLGVDQTGDRALAPTPAEVAGVAAGQPGAVFFAGAPSASGHLAALLRADGYQGSFMTGDGAGVPQFIAAAGRSSEQAYVSCSCDSVQSASAAVTFTTAFQAAYGTLPGPYAAEAFDATAFVLQAVAAGATEPAAVTAYLKTRSYSGVTGALTFGADGNAEHRSVYIRQVRSGKPTQVAALS